MKQEQRIFRLLVMGVCMIGAVIFMTGETNLSHQRMAAGILTMQECLDCHNGTHATAIQICLGPKCIYLKNHSMMNEYPPPGKEREYASREEIEQAGCILEKGRTTCLSCHDLTRPPPRLIREGDQLCAICHKKQV